MLLFSGSSNQPLAEKIADELKTKLANCEVVRFADGEVRVRILDNVQDQVCIVVQSTSTPADANLMELYQFGDLLKKGKAKKIIAVIPYLAYARQHKARRQGEAVSVSLVAKFIKSTGFSDVLLLEVHDEEVLNFFQIPVINISAEETIARFIDSHRDDFGGADLVFVAPDKGRKKQAEELAGIIETDFAVINKNRLLDSTDMVNSSTVQGEVKEKEAIIVDDVISTGSTVLEAANIVLKNGALHVYLIVTHAVFSRGEPSFWQNSPFEKIYVTDSIFVPKYKQFEKLEVISVAPLIAKSLGNLL